MALAPRNWLVSSICYLASIPFRFSIRHEFSPPERLLILKPCCVGDVLLTTPVAAALQRAFPGIRIDWAVGPWSRALVATNPRIGKIINTGRLGTGRGSVRELRPLIQRIRAENYDTCLVPDRSPVMAAIPWMAQIPQRIGLDSYGRGFCHQLRVPVSGIRHEAEIYLDLVRAMNVGTQGLGVEFYPTDEDRAAAEKILRQRLDWTEDEPLFVIHPAGGRNPGMTMLSKRWPPERFALLANRLLKAYGGKALLLGGPQDRTLLDGVNGLIPFKTVVMAGEIDWGVWGAILEKATLCAGNDTGATHLAVATGCKNGLYLWPLGSATLRALRPAGPGGRAVASHSGNDQRRQ